MLVVRAPVVSPSNASWKQKIVSTMLRTGCGSGSGGFLTPGSGIRNIFFAGSRIPDHKQIFLELIDNFFRVKSSINL
jgi:hypothetical protein